jgi:hypothetical protein
MDPDDVWRAIDAERLGLACLLDTLTTEQWESPSLCVGWRVRDVAAHLTLAQTGVPAAAMAGSRKKAPGVSYLEPLIDVLVHGQDIAIPLRLDRRMPAPAAMAAADRVWPDLYPFRARRRLAGIRFAATDCCWSAGEGLAAEGPIAAILLALTGRPAAVSQLSGPGVRELELRLAVPLKRVSC